MNLRRVLASIPKRSTAILTNAVGGRRPTDSARFNRAKTGAKMDERDLHFRPAGNGRHESIIGIPERVIAEIMAWEEEHVAKIIRRYVDRAAARKP
jgi:alkanesulfonate monooxygenase SsuD/methylene tetrahydromethanopterin reductase-like flavin-dependent oxidoreductase (luciferase family)